MPKYFLPALLLLAACAPPATPSPDRGEPPNRWLALAQSDTAASADSVGTWIVRGCRGMFRVDRTCVERALYSVLDGAGVAKATAALDVMAARDASVRRESHPLSHGLGIAAYLLNVPPTWILVGVVVLLGIGILMATSRTKPRDPPAV